jgi:Glycosyltransferases involved in cell wall biogenesis
MKVPKISIILPVYNAATYLPQILDDLIHQTLSDVEVVAVDDCSTDDSLEILKRYAGQYPMIRVLKNAQNQGCGSDAQCRT